MTGNIYGSTPRYELFADMGEADAALSVKRTTVAQAFTKVGLKMTFLFDCGDEWLFRFESIARGQSRGAAIRKSSPRSARPLNGSCDRTISRSDWRWRRSWLSSDQVQFDL